MKYIGSEKHLKNAEKARLLGLDKINENKKERIFNYYMNPSRCKNCNTELNYEKKNGKFCNSSCAAKFNNKKRKHTEKTKKLISKKLSGRLKDTKSYNLYYRICVICGVEFKRERKKNELLSKSKTCSLSCRCKLKSLRGKENMKKRIENGTHKGWIKRNIISYPEQFFINVLNNNNIKFKHNYPVNKRDLKLNDSYNYFLDFYIEDKKIDLEIDGKQHKYRQEHDIERDKHLKENGYNVYRIKWKNINTKKGSLYIKNEIKKFLEFYSNS